MVPLAEVAAANKPYLLIFDSIIAWWFTFISIPVWLPAYCAMALTAAVTKVWRYLRPMKKAATPSSQINGRISMIQANGLTTEILQWEPRSSDATTLVMVPGNPGAAEYYGPFLEEVHRLSGHTLRILCVGHPSHSARTGESLPLPLHFLACCLSTPCMDARPSHMQRMSTDGLSST